MLWLLHLAIVTAAGGSAATLAREVHDKGWVVYSATTAAGDWDLFLMRPDGSDRRNITRTPDLNEAGAKFSPDGRRLLYFRMPRGEVVDNNRYGTYELIMAAADGSSPQALGKDLPWASWGPEGRQLAVLTRTGIRFVDAATRAPARQIDRHGVVEQLVWSPDGKHLLGTANGLGEHWAIARVDAATGALNRVSDGDCFNCTPDWFPDSSRVVYSRGHPCTDGWAQLWTADGEGHERHMLYGETGRHIYGGAISPDGKYALFTRSREDLGKVDNSVTTMALMRLADAPIVGGAADSAALRRRTPGAKDGPVLDLGAGWEPHWTFAPVAARK
jgi:Tol biopolymer transport system component